jgi:hypothetical protein
MLDWTVSTSNSHKDLAKSCLIQWEALAREMPITGHFVCRELPSKKHDFGSNPSVDPENSTAGHDLLTDNLC